MSDKIQTHLRVAGIAAPGRQSFQAAMKVVLLIYFSRSGSKLIASVHGVRLLCANSNSFLFIVSMVHGALIALTTSTLFLALCPHRRTFFRLGFGV